MKYFILGILFIQIILPIIDEVFAVLLTYLEVLKGKASYKVAKYNVEIQKLGEEEEIAHNVIGFAIPTDENQEEEEDE